MSRKVKNCAWGTNSEKWIYKISNIERSVDSKGLFYLCIKYWLPFSHLITFFSTTVYTWIKKPKWCRKCEATDTLRISNRNIIYITILENNLVLWNFDSWAYNEEKLLENVNRARDTYKTIHGSSDHNNESSWTTQMAMKCPWINWGTVTWWNIPEQWIQGTIVGHSIQTSEAPFSRGTQDWVKRTNEGAGSALTLTSCDLGKFWNLFFSQVPHL